VSCKYNPAAPLSLVIDERKKTTADRQERMSGELPDESGQGHQPI